MPLHYAVAALEAGHVAEVFLVGEAVYLMKQEIADALNPVGLANVGELLGEAIGRGASFFV